MRRIIAVILLIIGTCFLIYDFARQQVILKEGLKETNTLTTQSSGTANPEENSTKECITPHSHGQ